MQIKPTILALVLVSLATSVSAAPPQTRIKDFGRSEFEGNCASCHGMDGKGSGPVTPWLTKAPPDLTTLAKNNGGILPLDRLYQSVSGEGKTAHGTRDMPVWGQTFRTLAAEQYMDYPYDPEPIVRARLLAILEYINRIQVGR